MAETLTKADLQLENDKLTAEVNDLKKALEVADKAIEEANKAIVELAANQKPMPVETKAVKVTKLPNGTVIKDY